MTSAVKPAIVGAFILSGLALGIGAILLFGSTHLFNPVVPAVVYFQGSVANLDVGAPVTFRGVKVGTVTGVSISLDMSDLTARIPVYLELDPSLIFLVKGASEETETGFERLLKAGLRAQLSMQSLITGKLRVDLDIQPGLQAAAGGDRNRPEIPSIPSQIQTIESEIASLPLKEMVENARLALASIQRVADELPRQIAPLTDSLKQTSDAAQTTLWSIDQLAATSRQQVSLSGAQMAQLLDSSDRMVRDADALMLSLQEMSGRESPMRSELDAAIRDLAASASSLRGFTREIERDPSALLYGRTSR
ncbi:MlaD family protein [Magnetospirillum fulvum]|uniref:Paraquat-inducible protein B n=1 Tax=Magnetospirillum fulvum TaxID=1082 RepID=A0A1H6H9N5_MAGFU|nr:MlaD family protein [Magnetospirillum fulvum]SEH30818.1 paraquat-inducible protein B [Magnetospirillum fulvum]